MATFVSTTLAKRTGATTTVFAPGITAANAGTLFESSALAGFGRQLTIAASRSPNMRRSSLLVRVPMLSDDGLSVLRYAQARLDVMVPDGMIQTDVDDLIGYINSGTAVGTTNLNDLLVNGHGVY